MVEHPLNLCDSLTDILTTEVAHGIRSINFGGMFVKGNASEIHLDPEQQTSAANVASWQVKRQDVINGSCQEVRGCR